MPASTRRGALWWRVMPALIATAGLGIAPASASARASMVTTVYVANGSSASITPVDAATGTAGPPIRIRADPYLLAASPDGTTLYAATPTAIIPISTAQSWPSPPPTARKAPRSPPAATTPA